jgi:hypothetical protein
LPRQRVVDAPHRRERPIIVEDPVLAKSKTAITRAARENPRFLRGDRDS